MPVTEFTRMEKKYLLYAAQYAAFMERAAAQLLPDDYGSYTVRSLYLDNQSDEMIRRSLEKPLYKEKLRLRGYGELSGDSTVFLEIKKKYRGVGYKQRSALTLSAAEALLYHGRTPPDADGTLREIMYTIAHYGAVPRALITCRRTAYVGKEQPDLRLTVDRDICGSYENLSMLSRGGAPLLPDGARLLEIKVCAAMPFWLVRLLEELELYPTSFSKYGKAYTHQKEAIVCSQPF